ncbi:MAG: hypothetical protein Kow0077_16830 [Anaerolineae bacterium]
MPFTACDQQRITYADGQWADVSIIHAPADSLRFQDLDPAPAYVRMRDAARLRYFKARIRGEEAPLSIAWAALEHDRPAQRMFPTLDTTSHDGEHFLSANSFITYVLRELVRHEWLRFRNGEWYAEVPASEPLWEERAVVILHWLMAENRIWFDAGPGMPIPSRTQFTGCDPLLHVTAVGRCGYVRDMARTTMPSAVFNTSFFLLEHDDYISHYSAMGDPYGLLVADGSIRRPPLYRRSTLWQAADGTWQVSRIGMEDIRLHLPGETLILPPGSPADGLHFALNSANSDSDPLIVYTRAFGIAEDGVPHGVTPESKGRFELVIVDDTVKGWKRGGNLLIPQNGFVLSFAVTRDGQPLQELGDLEPGIIALRHLLNGGTIGYSFDRPELRGMRQAQQNGPVLLREGQIVISDQTFAGEEYWLSRMEQDGYRFGIVPTEFPTDAGQTRAARIGIGIDTAGNLVIVAISGASKGIARPGIDSAGATLMELAKQLQLAGAVEAINLDGGGSTQVFVEGGLYNSPGDRRGRQGVTYERLIPTVGVID